jgi:hypothetical protein
LATRCNVIVEDNGGYRIFMYRHNDGYPESVLPALAPILSALRNNKDKDNSHDNIFVQSRLERIADLKKSAAYVAAKIEDIEETINGEKTYRPFEFTTDIHGDIEWLYTLNVDTTELHYEHLRTGLKQVR